MERKQKRRRAPELVHGLTETVDLKDWDFAILLAALKLYIKDAKDKGKSRSVIAYAQQLQKKLRVPFARLVKRTKREHRRLKNQLTHRKGLLEFTEELILEERRQLITQRGP